MRERRVRAHVGVYTCVVTVTVPQNKPARFSIRMHSLGRDEVIMKSLPPPPVHPPLARYLPRRCVTHAVVSRAPSPSSYLQLRQPVSIIEGRKIVWMEILNTSLVDNANSLSAITMKITRLGYFDLFDQTMDPNRGFTFAIHFLLRKGSTAD